MLLCLTNNCELGSYSHVTTYYYLWMHFMEIVIKMTSTIGDTCSLTGFNMFTISKENTSCFTSCYFFLCCSYQWVKWLASSRPVGHPMCYIKCIHSRLVDLFNGETNFVRLICPSDAFIPQHSIVNKEKSYFIWITVTDQ